MKRGTLNGELLHFINISLFLSLHLLSFFQFSLLILIFLLKCQFCLS